MQPTDRDLLLVIDLQNDFCPGGALAVAGGDEIVPVVNRLGARFAHAALTQDWHPPGHGSFASAHPGRRPFETITAAFTRNPDLAFPQRELAQSIAAAVGPENADFIDATRLATALLGDSIASNLFLLGFAYQKGLIPVSAASIEQAVALNAVAVGSAAIHPVIPGRTISDSPPTGSATQGVPHEMASITTFG